MDEKVKLLELDNDISSKKIEKLEIMNRKLEKQLANSMKKLTLRGKQNQKMSKRMRVLEKMIRKKPKPRKSVKKETVSVGVPISFKTVKFNILTDGMMEIRVYRLNTNTKEKRHGTIDEMMEYFRSLVRHPNTKIEHLSIKYRFAPASNEHFQEMFASLTDSLGHQLNVQELSFFYDASEQKLIEILGALCPTRLRTLNLSKVADGDRIDFGEVSKMEQWENATTLTMNFSEGGIHVVRNLARFSHFETLDLKIDRLDKKMILEMSEFCKKNKSADRDFTIRIWNNIGDELQKAFGIEIQKKEEINEGIFLVLFHTCVRLCNYRERRS